MNTPIAAHPSLDVWSACVFFVIMTTGMFPWLKADMKDKVFRKIVPLVPSPESHANLWTPFNPDLLVVGGSSSSSTHHVQILRLGFDCDPSTRAPLSRLIDILDLGWTLTCVEEPSTISSASASNSDIHTATCLSPDRESPSVEPPRAQMSSRRISEV